MRVPPPPTPAHALVAAIENLLHLQVDLLCKAVPLAHTRSPSLSHSLFLSIRVGSREWSWSWLQIVSLCCCCCFSSKLPVVRSMRRCCCHFPICTFISMPVDNFHLPPIPFPSPSLFSSCCYHIATRPRAKWTAAANQLTFRFDLKCSNYQHYKRWTASALSLSLPLAAQHGKISEGSLSS